MKKNPVRAEASDLPADRIPSGRLNVGALPCCKYYDIKKIDSQSMFPYPLFLLNTSALHSRQKSRLSRRKLKVYVPSNFVIN